MHSEGHISIIIYALLRIHIAPNILILLISQSLTLSEDILFENQRRLIVAYGGVGEGKGVSRALTSKPCSPDGPGVCAPSA